jgi:pseudaminic acid synthase
MKKYFDNKINNIFKKNYNYKSFIVAEISANHNGNINNIIKIIDKAKSIGIDAIKLQLYKADRITLDVKCPEFRLPKKNPWSKYKTFYDVYKKGETPYSWFSKLLNICNKRNIILFSSVFDKSTVDFLEKKNCPIYKIASAEITDIPLIEKVSKTGKPVFISSGMADKKDLDLAIRILKKNCKKIVLMQCTSTYPAPIEEVNIKTMIDYEKKFKIKIGYSDHTSDNISSIVAATHGARVIEKHVVINKNIRSLDSFFSFDLNKFTKFVKDIRLAEKSLGKIDYSISKSSKKSAKNRKSLYVCMDIKKGQKFSKYNIRSIRPGYGLHPKHFHKIIGKKSRFDYKKGDKLT